MCREGVRGCFSKLPAQSCMMMTCNLLTDDGYKDNKVIKNLLHCEMDNVNIRDITENSELRSPQKIVKQAIYGESPHL